ncbi:Bug family tripartite tricarboxylate transporter substrate binding protein [Cupriavidus sp. AcVe19-6a]|uniref:Bug family tripartite tricarboxylate transporter substrate binding protein n=1 Tax=Cupriavidus sp. AcVe19-6a TaxID=2821358 RepID=UPI00352D11C5
MTRKLFSVVATALAVTACSFGNAVAAEAWPSRPIRLVVPFPAGGAVDYAARLVGERLSTRLKQPVIVDNKPGAGSTIGVMAVTKSEPDGYTLLMSGSTSLTVNPAIRAKLPYDPLKDLAPIAIVASGPLVLLTNSSKPYHNFAELVAKAKASPSSLSYYTYGPGTIPHLAGELLAESAGISFRAIPYKGSNEAVLALLRGEVDIGLDTVFAAAPYIRTGQLRALAVTGLTRSSFLPQVPSFSELKIPQASVDGFSALMAPAKTPAPIMDRLVQEVSAIMAMPDVKEKLSAQSLETAAIGPAAARTKIETDLVKFRQLAKALNISLE